MAAPLSTCTVEEQRSFIRFLWSEGVKPSEITEEWRFSTAPSDFHLFGPTKEHLRGQKFADEDEVMEAVHSWLQTTPKIFFLEGIRKLVDRWTKCVAKQGDYVEK